eukprot:1178946-Prymnesium_polylepis.1
MSVRVSNILPWNVPLRNAMTSGSPDDAAAGATNATKEAAARTRPHEIAAKTARVAPSDDFLSVAVHAVVALNGSSDSSHLSKMRSKRQPSSAPIPRRMPDPISPTITPTRTNTNDTMAASVLDGGVNDAR